MELGFGLVTCQRHPNDPEARSDAEVYEQALALAMLADDAGLGSFWVSEHHFVDDGYQPASTVLLGALATVTERIVLGAGVILGPLWHPLRLAEDLAVVDLLARGRLVVGLGLGWRPEEFDGFGADPRRRVHDLERLVTTLRGAWAGAPVGNAGVVVTPQPHTPGGPPVWIGGFVPRAVERAARIGDGYFASVTSVDELRQRVEIVRSSGRPVSIGAHVPVFVWDGPEDPWELVRDWYWYIRWKYADMAGARSRPPSPAPVPPLAPDQEAGLRAGPVVGRPAAVLEQLRAIGELLTDDGHLVARSYFPGMPWELQRRQVGLLGELAAELRR